MSSSLTDSQIEELLYKIKANKNSEYLKENGKLDLLKETEISSLDEYIMKLERGEIIVNPEEQNLDKFEKTKILLPNLEEVDVYETPKVSANRKIDAIEEKNLSRNSKNDDLIKYSIITLKKSDDTRIDLVIDSAGYDLGVITYDEKGNPNFEISSRLKEQIDDKLNKANIRSFTDEQTIQEEFYLKDINSFIKAVKEGKVVPESENEAKARAASALNIKNGIETAFDLENAIIQRPNEISEKDELELNSRLAPIEKERNITEEKRENEEVLNDEQVRAIQSNPQRIKTADNAEKENDDSKNENIPENKKEEIEKICNNSKNNLKEKISAVLIIKDPSTLYDCSKNSGIDRNGNEVTVVQFSDITGKERYIIIQDGKECNRDDRAFRDLIAPLKATSGVYKRVEDNENYIDYRDSSGKLQTTKIKRVPRDMTLTEKENFRERLEKDLQQLDYVRTYYPENKALIDRLEINLEKDFIEVGLVPPESIKEDADLLEAPQEEVASVTIEEEEDPDFDELGRRNRKH